MLKKDISTLEHIIEHCRSIFEIQDRFGRSKEIFSKDKAYQLSTCMCILQIGELIGRLSEETQNSIQGIQWKSLKAMRNIFAHNYETMDKDITWDVLTNEIPDIYGKCRAAVGRGHKYMQVSIKALEELQKTDLIIGSKIIDGASVIKYYEDNEQAINEIISKTE